MHQAPHHHPLTRAKKLLFNAHSLSGGGKRSGCVKGSKGRTRIGPEVMQFAGLSVVSWCPDVPVSWCPGVPISPPLCALNMEQSARVSIYIHVDFLLNWV